MIKNLTLLLLGISIGSPILSAPSQWNWQAIDVEKVAFPKHFIFGVAMAEHQNSGALNCPDSNWARWETLTDEAGKPRIVHGQQSGVACDFWHRYKNDITLMQELGVTSCRFSIDWSSIEPTQGIWNEEALTHYSDVCDAMIEAGIEPMVTLHHFVHPLWFEDLGGFAKEENIYYFVRFCTKVFQLFGQRIRLWSTINEPTVFAMQGYMRGVFPPGKVDDMQAVAQVLKNLLVAHCRVYTKLKSMPGGAQAQIGLVHSVLPYHAYSDSVIASCGLKVVEYGLARFMNYVYNDSVMNFLKNGSFNVNIPFTMNVNYAVAKPGKEYLDFLGINFYSRVLLKVQPTALSSILSCSPALPHKEELFNSSCYKDEIMTDMPYAHYPQGIYESIKEFSCLGVPIYITENGVADRDDSHREQFIKRYLYALHKALEDGFDVRGYYYWSLMDNFEWDEGFEMKFGLYEVDFETQKRTLRQGAKYYQKIALQTRPWQRQ